jgi:hypothetical protein
MKHPISVSIKPAAAHTSPESNTLHVGNGVSHWADNQHHLAELTMTRDDVLVWLSFLGFVALSGAAIWVLFPL